MSPTAVTTAVVDLEPVLKALASERRRQILQWLKDPTAHFPPQEHGDPELHGACNQFIVEGGGGRPRGGSRHLKVLVDAGLIIATRRKGWTYYRRDEAVITAVIQELTHL